MQVQLISSQQTKPLRHLVLWPHILHEKDCAIDIDERDDAIHLGTYEGENLVSVGSLFRMTSPKINIANQYRLRAMATHLDYRAKNCGKLLIEKAIEILREKNAEVLWCDARIGAVGFYLSLGFNVMDETYDVPLIGPHKFMWLLLK